MSRLIWVSLAVISILAFDKLIPPSVEAVEKSVMPIQEFKGKFLTEEEGPLKKEAPESGYITDETSWKKLWKSWRGLEELPKVDFEKQLVLVVTAQCGANTIRATFYLDDKGDLKGNFISTLIGGPGFAYLIVVVDRTNVKTYEGKAIKKVDRDPVAQAKKQEAMTTQILLEKARASGSWPEGMVIRMGACLGGPDVKAAADRIPDELKETWEFTSNQVHRVAFEYQEDNSTDHRVESRPFDSKSICKDLLDGKAIEIQARKGEGPEVAFVGTSYHLGSRFIDVEWNGETILNLLESNTTGRVLYRETDARAFGELYERLASQARTLFKSQAAEAK